MTVRDPNNPLEVKRHSFAHLAAAAVCRLFPGTKLGVGPVIDDGFYHDVELPQGKKLTDADLPRIEAEVRKMMKEVQTFVREIKPIDEAVAWLEERGQGYTVELARDLKEEGLKEVSFYTNGEFSNMCTGPHVASTKKLDSKAFRLTRLAGVYWKSDSKRTQIQRVYGVAFNNTKELDAFLKLQEEARKRDHRKIGRDLDLFTFSPLVGAGLPLFTPRGTLMRRLLEEFVQSLQEPMGYQRVWIPHLAKSDLYKTSGHWDKFKDDLFYVHGKHDNEYVLKPMNCPHHTQIYASRPRSFRDLPLRLSEVTTVYRDEQPGELLGISRVLSLTQDDAHVFCAPSQMRDEAKKMFQLIRSFYKVFDMKLSIRLSRRDPKDAEKYLGSAEVWEKTEKELAQLLKEEGEDYADGIGEAAFYGPKLDFLAHDALGRVWQLATIQLDFNQPERFGLVYTDEKGGDARPLMIHRAISGSLERFLSVLIEHFAGIFPLWLSPMQMKIIPVGKTFHEFAWQLSGRFSDEEFRVEVDDANETVSNKIRKAQQWKIPYMLVVGEKETKNNTLTVRARGTEKPFSVALNEFIKRAQKLNKERSLSLW